MVNQGNHSEFENMLMSPLETAIPLNLEEAVFPSQAPWLPLSVFHDVGRDFALEMMRNDVVHDNGYM